MDFKNILTSLSTIAEGETKDTTTGRVHKGSYGSEFQTDKDGNEKKAEKPEVKRGRGRPKKDSDETGEVKKYDTKSLQNFMIGNKPKKEVGTVSKKHSLKEYFDEVSEAKQLDEMMPQQPIPVVSKQGDTQSTGTGFLNITGNSPAEQAMLKALGDLAKQKKAQIVVPTTQQKPAGTTIAPMSTGTAQGVSMGEAEGPMLNTQAGGLGAGRDPNVLENSDTLEIGQMMANDGIKYDPNKEKEIIKLMISYMTKAGMSKRQIINRLSHNEDFIADQLSLLPKEGMSEAKSKPDFLDLDKDGNKKETMKKAQKDKEKVDESRDQESSEYLDEKVAKILAREKPNLVTKRNNSEFYGAIYNELVACGLTPKAARYKVSYDEDFISDVASAYNHYLKNPTLDEESFKPTAVAPQNIPAVQRKEADAAPLKLSDITRTTNISDPANLRALGMGQEIKPMGLSMKDVKFEGWDKQLNNLLTEGITVSSSTGQQGTPDSVTVSASDADAEQLLQVLRQAGIGVFGGAEQAHSGYGAPISSEEPSGTGTEPEVSPDVVGDGDDMLSLIKRMSGFSVEPEGTASADYEEEDEYDTGEEGTDTEAPETGEDRDEDSEDSGEESTHSREDSDDSEVEEGNKFTGNLAKARAAGKEEADLDGDGDMEKVHEGEHTCEACGMMETKCECDTEEVTEWANDAGGDASDDAEMAKLKALLTLGNDLNKPKRDQTVLNPTQVTVSESINQWKKLSGIK